MFDMGQILDEVFEKAKEFKHAFKDGFPNFCGEGQPGFHWDENVDFYPHYSFPPANIYVTENRELTFEFALAGFEEKNITLEFHGDYLVLSAKPPVFEEPAGVRYFKRRLKWKPVECQKYHAPEKRFDREKVKAVFKNGILKVTVPPKEGYTTGEGIKIEIVKEGE